MTGQIVLRRPSMPLQRPKLETKESSSVSSNTTASEPSTPSRSARFADAAGGTTAACAAVCCCCPCGLVNLIVLAIVRLPAGLCKKAIKKHRRKKKTRLLEQSKRYEEDAEMQMDVVKLGEISSGWWPDKSPSLVVSEMDNEMWTTLYGTGFWRNPSGREQ